MTTDTTPAVIAALLEGVTPGPWRVEDGTTLIWGHCNQDDTTSRGMGYPVAECRITPISSWASGPDADAGEANARFIAAARDLVPALAAERDRLADAAEYALRVANYLLEDLRHPPADVYLMTSSSAKVRSLADVRATLAALNGETL